METFRKNKREIPLEFLDVEKRDRRSSRFGFSNKITLVSYSYVPDSKKKNVLFSSMHRDDKIDSSFGDDKKPDIITFYNATKGAVDTVDQMSKECDTSRNSRRWPMTFFILSQAEIFLRFSTGVYHFLADYLYLCQCRPYIEKPCIIIHDHVCIVVFI